MSTSLKDLVPLVADDPPQEGQIVNAPEFDLTQVAKKLAVTIPVFAAAILGGLKALGVEEATEPPYVVAALGVTAAGLLALGVVAAADILGRAYASAHSGAMGSPAPSSPQSKEEDKSVDPTDVERKRADSVAEEERKRLDVVSEEERTRKDRVSEDERSRLDREAASERERLDRVAADERERRDRIAAEKRGD